MDEIVSADLYHGPDDERLNFGEDAPEDKPDKAAAMRQEIRTANRGAFGRAPEVVNAEREQAADELLSIEQGDLTNAWDEASRQAARAQQAEELAAALNEGRLDNLALADFENLYEDPAAIADELLVNGSGWRLANFVENWSAVDGDTASAWAADRQARVEQVVVEQNRQQLEAARQEAEQARVEAAQNFWNRHKLDSTDEGTLLAAAATTMPELARASPAEIEQTLGHTLATTKEALRAQAQAEREREIRAAFTQPTFSDIKMNRPPRPEPVVGESSILNRMRRVESPELKAARRQQALEDFRFAFAEEARPKFGPGSRPA